MPFLPTSEAPFGFLNPLHAYVLNNAGPITSTNWPRVLILPLVPVTVQCYLLQFPDTQLYRIGIGAVGVTGLLQTWTHYRFYGMWLSIGRVSSASRMVCLIGCIAPEYNAFNAGLGLTFLHVAGKYVQFAAMEEPMVDPYTEKGRSRVMSAVDLAMNSRMLDLGSVGIASVGLHGQASVPNGANGHVPVAGEKLKPVRRVRNRSEATARHFLHFLVHWTTLDTLLWLMSNLGPTTIGNPRGCPNAIYKFVNLNTFVAFPSLYPIVVPPILVEGVVTLGLAVGTWQGFSMAYHFFATLAVGSGFWETESWERDLFDRPWKAESMLDLWGRRWHQLFRVGLSLPNS